ncbi:hypothetical protein NIES4073_82460 [Kalymmatonema gypsitolerans NIES-4073]|nr:hypothetical protein NIES4073_82460 [Scytonema sp. NIES-4073]
MTFFLTNLLIYALGKLDLKLYEALLNSEGTCFVVWYILFFCHIVLRFQPDCYFINLNKLKMLI